MFAVSLQAHSAVSLLAHLLFEPIRARPAMLGRQQGAGCASSITRNLILRSQNASDTGPVVCRVYSARASSPLGRVVHDTRVPALVTTWSDNVPTGIRVPALVTTWSDNVPTGISAFWKWDAISCSRWSRPSVGSCTLQCTPVRGLEARRLEGCGTSIPGTRGVGLMP